MIYSFDTSAILDGWRRYYPPDVFQSLWVNLDNLIDNGVIIASEEVLHDLEKQEGDEVHQWALARKQMFVDTDEQVQREVTEILENHKKLIDQRGNRSASDPFVIAVAKIKGGTVLTGERPTKSPEKRPHIPDVCSSMGIDCVDMVGLIRAQNWSF